MHNQLYLKIRKDFFFAHISQSKIHFQCVSLYMLLLFMCVVTGNLITLSIADGEKTFQMKR